MSDAAWTPRALAPDTPVYRAIADALAADVADGRVPAGARLPTHRALAESLGVTVTTVSRAYAEAARRGLTESTVGRGTFARAPHPTEPAATAPPRGPLTFDFPQTHAPGVPADPGAPVDLGPNLPVPLGLGRRLAETLADLSTAPAALAPLLDYHLHHEETRHRAAAAAWMARAGAHDDPDAVVITAGVQHGLAVALMTLLRPGDTLLCATLTYPNLKLLADRQGVSLHGVALDAEGLVPEAVDEAAARTGARALFCMPTLQNPTAVVASSTRREALAGVAARHGLAVIEDDIYGLLPADRPPPLAALIPARTVFLTSSAKTLAPGLRTGFALVPPPWRALFAACLRATIWMATPLTVEITTRWIEDGTADALVQGQRRALAARLDLAAEALDGLPWQGAPGTPHLWLPLPAPWRAETFRDALTRRGVLVQPAAVFHVGPGTMPEAVRLCLGAEPDPARLRHALGVVRAVLSAGPAARAMGP
ncbi:PLP-dependent aminotransferase family protein [Roseospira navarrensis]|uniref:Aminotransferase class I/II-fold pyridoxal phosphate-dependent enzyme n=1 Tax=Roseospira navarrensis TaxID=140058 RepID=A0A7X2D2F3_9PROT|nr:PLP-dependent aminotransferase family protein [Roseospira navarrensis]MQX36234.1 aminotransferase class I/II-fold pyridoxal phosphate-dependent enzyme [Roseospira navarrensis]